jgi:DNA gyrase subunit A
MTMSEVAKEVIGVNIEDELKRSYLDYSMSVIIGRALPDVRDGLKPVHRRVLFAMRVLNNEYNKPYKKSARVVGDVIGKYHPHGDTAVYDTIVRMAQTFSMRYLLVDGQGNFGSVDGDSAAAMRYTEVRMTRLSHELLSDLDKETVDFVPNYDESEWIPDVLPTKVPLLLVNGSSGIAVGMATNIPPHNLTEVINASLAVLDKPDITIDELLPIVPGPDFPTAGIINGRAGIVKAYRTGRGRIYVRGKANFEGEENKKQAIIVTELPYQVNKSLFVEKIAFLVKEKKLDGIVGLRDESDKDGMRVVIELRRGESPEVVLNNLYSQTQMQSVFGINIVALDNGQPKILNLKELLDAFIRHRHEVVTRRTIYLLRKAKEKAHLLEGLTIALVNIDPVIALIKAAKNSQAAKKELIATVWPAGSVVELLEKTGADNSRPDTLSAEYGLLEDGYHLSPEQAQAILDLRLHKLTGLEQNKITAEFEELLKRIHEFMLILSDNERLKSIIREELNEIKTQFGDERRTEIIASQQDFTTEDLIAEEDVVVTFSHLGYAKCQDLDAYAAQRRGGRGRSATNVKDEDFIEHLLVANTHDTILCFSDLGKVYWLRVFQLPRAGRSARGKPIINLLPLEKGERISAILPFREYSDDQFVFMATARGIVKKVALSSFQRPRASGIIAVDLSDGDHLIGADVTHGDSEVMLFSDTGKVVRFNEDQVRAVGRTARGVRGIKLGEGHKVVSLIVVHLRDDPILTATENGYGKRTHLQEFRKSNRGGQGVISIQVTERNGDVVGAMQISEKEDVMLISNRGTLVRIPAKSISLVGRNTQGVRLINLNGGDEQLVSVERIAEITELDDITTTVHPSESEVSSDHENEALTEQENNERSSEDE